MSPVAPLLADEDHELEINYSTRQSKVARPSVVRTLCRIKRLMASVFLNFVITFLVFPGIVLAAQCPGLSATWYSVLIGFTYNCGDMLGRLLANHCKLLGPNHVWLGIFLR